MSDTLQYQHGFGNTFNTEAIDGVLPAHVDGNNTPQHVKHGLYAEQMSGSAFTAPNALNRYTWCYRILPSVIHAPHADKPLNAKNFKSTPFCKNPTSPNQMRWGALDIPTEPTDFIDGINTIVGNGSIDDKSGLAIHIYTINTSMKNRFFKNSDAEMLFIPEKGSLLLKTEMGHMHIAPKEIAVIPRGIVFSVETDGDARGYLCENYGQPFQMPEMGLIGPNGSANSRNFQYPVAAFENIKGDFDVVTKFCGDLWVRKQGHSPLNVVAWSGNYAPYKYNLDKFSPINFVKQGHSDPSIFTVLTSPSHAPGVANVDFVAFAPRWIVGEKTFRPPYFHRNVMSEYMGLIEGVYDGKNGGGFVPGGASLHNRFAGHGPDSTTTAKARNEELKPQYLDHTLAFMLESYYVLRPTEFAMNATALQKDYYKCWQDLPPADIPDTK